VELNPTERGLEFSSPAPRPAAEQQTLRNPAADFGRARHGFSSPPWPWGFREGVGSTAAAAFARRWVERDEQGEPDQAADNCAATTREPTRLDAREVSVNARPT